MVISTPFFERSLAEGVGFEPTFRFRKTVFKTAAFSHSAIPPGPRLSGSRFAVSFSPVPACSLLRMTHIIRPTNLRQAIPFIDSQNRAARRSRGRSSQWRCRSCPTDFPPCTPGISENRNDRSSRKEVFGRTHGKNTPFSFSFWILACCLLVVLPLKIMWDFGI